jgi:aminoglycoside phosphotransferase (APT) family kinase protein
LRSILDWETAKVGDPMEDLAWVCTRMWRFGEDHLAVGGLGTIAQLRDAYVSAGGTWDDDRFLWWRVLVTMRWGTGLANQAAMHLDGRFSSVVMAASGRRVAELAYDALTLIDSP